MYNIHSHLHFSHVISEEFFFLIFFYTYSNIKLQVTILDTNNSDMVSSILIFYVLFNAEIVFICKHLTN